jgi:D-alanine-D-alanine ligase
MNGRVRVVYLADIFEVESSSELFTYRSDLEKTDPQTVAEVLQGLRDAGFEAIHIADIPSLTRHIQEFPDDIVISTYAGERSRSRTSLIAATCEGHGTPYVGLDAYGQAVCHDKALCKIVAQQCGLLTPASRVYRPGLPLSGLRDFPPPFILKPLAEGSSIGVSARSVIRNIETAEAVAQELFDRIGGPIMAERFVAGREVSLGAIETAKGPLTAFSEIRVAGDPDYFVDRVWDAEEKYHRNLDRHVALIDNELHPDDRAAIMQLLSVLGNFGWIRIDGRLSEGRLQFIEASPDAHLGVRSQFAQGFMLQGMTYSEVLGLVVQSASLRPLGPTAIAKES